MPPFQFLSLDPCLSVAMLGLPASMELFELVLILFLFYAPIYSASLSSRDLFEFRVLLVSSMLYKDAVDLLGGNLALECPDSDWSLDELLYSSNPSWKLNSGNFFLDLTTPTESK